MRNDNDILNAYLTNQTLTSQECRKLYSMVNDPWNRGTDQAREYFFDFCKELNQHIDLSTINFVIDFGCGVGSLSTMIRPFAHPKCRIMGFDFPEVMIRSNQINQGSSFDYPCQIESEFEFLNTTNEPIWWPDNALILFSYSAWYPFSEMEYNSQEQIDNLSLLVNKLSNYFHARFNTYIMCSYPGFHYMPMTNALNQCGYALFLAYTFRQKDIVHLFVKLR